MAGGERDGRELGSNPGVQVPSHWAQEEANARRRDTDRAKGRESPASESAPGTFSGGIWSPRRWEMLSLDVYGRGEGAIPRSKLTGASELLRPEHPKRKRRDSRDRTGDPRRLRSHPVAPRAEVPEERASEKGALMKGKRMVETPETQIWI